MVMHSSWLDSLIWTGYKRELKQEDLYETPESCRSQKLLRGFKKCVCVCVYVCTCVYVCVRVCACVCVLLLYIAIECCINALP